MKCGCEECGALMDHVEKGDESYCICPQCLYTCRDCLGGENKRFHFLDRETVKHMKEDTDKHRNKK